jgi:hypothetical protein
MRNLIAVLLATLLAIAAEAQTTLSTLVGRVTAGDAGVPGVTISVNSPSLQGQRTAVSGPDGQYVLPALPPGDYLVTFTLSGMQQVVQRAQLRLSETTRVDAVMLQQSLNEEIVVQAADQTVIETPQVSMNMDARTIELLPTTRGIMDFAKLAPGVIELSMQGGRTFLAISGALPYDNLYMVNGVTITDRRTNVPLNLYIEDTIQEATVLTAGVSAEYGRFIGGVVNVITKSGGNTLSGSIRDTITSHAWTEKTPFPGELDHLDDVNHELQGTLGGRVVRDRLWFFLAGRDVSRDFGRQTRLTNIGYTNETAEHRYEAKLTGNVTPNHSIVGSYLNVRNRNRNEGVGIDFRSGHHVHNDFSLAALRYAGVVRQNILVEGQFSTKQHAYRARPAAPGIDDTFVNGSQLSVVGGNMWAPAACVICGPDEGHGRDLLLKVSRFLPTRRYGAHQLLVGVDEYHDMGRSVGGVSSSNFTIFAGEPDIENGVVTPHFRPGETQIDFYDGRPEHRADFRTRSLFVNDQVTIGSRLTLNAGLRYDQNHGKNVDGIVVVNDARLSPRLGVVYDLRGNGNDRFSASFGRYSSKALENALAPATSEFSPAIYEWIYDGPEISGLPTAEAMALLAAWFEARGGLRDRSDAEFFPSLAYAIGERLTSPATDEYTLGYGHQFGSSGLIQVHYVNRRSFDYYTVHQTLANPQIVVDNDSDGKRAYDSIGVEGRWRSRRFNVGGTYTWSKLYGNIEQGTQGIPGADASGRDWYPEYSQYPQHKPMGWLQNDMRHVANLWVGYDLSTERTHINVSALQRYHSARNYNAIAQLQVRNIIPNPGYEFLPNALPYYVQPRGGLRLDDITATGIALNAARRFGMVELFGQFDVTNVFGEDGIENPAVDAVVLTNLRDRNLAPFNPVTTTPIECPRGVASSSAQCRGIAHYRYSPTFGKPTSTFAYQQPRTYSVAFGAKF